MSVLLAVGVILALVAAAVHVAIFALETLLWPRASVHRLFGARSREDAERLRLVMANQGFYNLFLAVGGGAGALLVLTGVRQAGFALAIFACLAMALAAIVLLGTNRRLWRAALVQGTAPLLAVVALATELLTAA